MQKIIDWLVKTTEDLKAFDEHLRAEVQKYSNKQAKKVFIVGAVCGLAIGLLFKV